MLRIGVATRTHAQFGRDQHGGPEHIARVPAQLGLPACAATGFKAKRATELPRECLTSVQTVGVREAALGEFQRNPQAPRVAPQRAIEQRCGLPRRERGHKRQQPRQRNAREIETIATAASEPHIDATAIGEDQPRNAR